MATNPFKQQKAFAPSLNRNNFDLSFTNNGTFNFGYLYPVLCHEVLPGDKTVIDPRMALRAFPLVFPIQTRVRAHIHFFYQRNRNLWKGFTDFINGNTEASSPDDHSNNSKCSPYVDDMYSPRLFRTGSLGDYLGLPTTIPNNVNILSDDVMPLTFMYPDSAEDGLANIYPYRVIDGASHVFTDNNRLPDSANLVVGRVTSCKTDDYLITNYSSDFHYEEVPSNNLVSKLFRGNEKTASNMVQCYAGVVFPSTTGVHRRVVFTVYEDQAELKEGRQFALFGHLSSKVGDSDISDDPDAAVLHDGEVYHKVPVVVSSHTDIGGNKYFRITCDIHNETTAGWSFVLFCGDVLSNRMTKSHYLGGLGIDTYNITKELDYINNGYDVFTASYGNAVSALPFRCYESIYNAFYRDSRNNPFIDRDGVQKFNEYLPSVEGGLDTYPYHIHRRNWELDMFTSCVQSPQQGVAPLVGISSLGEVTFSDEDGKSYTFATETASDADTITNVKVTENVPNSVARSIVNLVSSGISINDFRNVNAFQRWKETNIRRGLKFKDQIKARWGVDVGYNTLDMPEFLGGMSVDIDVNAVNQMADSPDAPLGSYAGQASAFGSTNNKISCYSDEHGFIMAILSIVPVPCYSQTLPRYFRRFSPLDYYNPEFGKIGMQAVTYRDLCPVNACLSHAGTTSKREELDKVFGYNRPWPEYLSRFDEVHGEFRTTLKDFLLMREFAGLPELGSDFTTVNPDDLNNVFATEYGDKFLGAIYFDIQCKRPIPSISIPALE